MVEHFLSACLLMGAGIGIDVAIATALRTQALQRQKLVWLWIIGVTLTHTVFPMAGYLLAYFSIQTLPALTPIIGMIAFALIAKFLWDELMVVSDSEDDNQLLVTLGIILAVSWDALWSGPAKSAQVLGWSELMVWLSFILVGFVVMAFAVVAYRMAQYFCQLNAANGKTMVALQWLQYSVICYFGLLALIRYTFSLDTHSAIILAVASLLTAILMEFAVSREQLRKA